MDLSCDSTEYLKINDSSYLYERQLSACAASIRNSHYEYGEIPNNWGSAGTVKSK